MKYFAHIETGRTVDVIGAIDVADYQRILGKHAEWQIVEVKSDTQNGATPDGQGGWTNPVAPAPPAPPGKKPVALGGVDFHNYCAAALAVVNGTSVQDGMARLGDIIGAMQAVPGGLVKIASNRYQAAGAPGGKYVLSDIQALMGALVAAGVVKQPEADGIVAGWPQQ